MFAPPTKAKLRPIQPRGSLSVWLIIAYCASRLPVVQNFAIYYNALTYYSNCKRNCIIDLQKTWLIHYSHAQDDNSFANIYVDLLEIHTYI